MNSMLSEMLSADDEVEVSPAAEVLAGETVVLLRVVRKGEAEPLLEMELTVRILSSATLSGGGTFLGRL